MHVLAGFVYFIKDEYFDLIQDPYVKWNHHDRKTGQSAKRPFFIAFQDKNTDFYWAVPLSSKTEKYKRMIECRKKQGKQSDIIKIAKIHGRESVFLFLDMIPVPECYIEKQYIRNGQPFHPGSRQLTRKLISNAKKINELLKKGYHFSPIQADIMRIEKILFEDKHASHNKRMQLVLQNMKEKQIKHQKKNTQKHSTLDKMIKNSLPKTSHFKNVSPTDHDFQL